MLRRRAALSRSRCGATTSPTRNTAPARSRSRSTTCSACVIRSGRHRHALPGQRAAHVRPDAEGFVLTGVAEPRGGPARRLQAIAWIGRGVSDGRATSVVASAAAPGASTAGWSAADVRRARGAPSWRAAPRRPAPAGSTAHRLRMATSSAARRRSGGRVVSAGRHDDHGRIGFVVAAVPSRSVVTAVAHADATLVETLPPPLAAVPVVAVARAPARPANAPARRDEPLDQRCGVAHGCASVGAGNCDDADRRAGRVRDDADDGAPERGGLIDHAAAGGARRLGGSASHRRRVRTAARPTSVFGSRFCMMPART